MCILCLIAGPLVRPGLVAANVLKRLAQALAVVAELRLGNGKVLPADADGFGNVAGGKAFQSVQNGSRLLVLARQLGLAGHRPDTAESGGSCADVTQDIRGYGTAS
jgi:hypothetical protein